MDRKTVKHTLLGLALVGAATLAAAVPFSTPLPAAHADSSCTAMLQGLEAWAGQGPGYAIRFALASNRAGQLVSYTTGVLTVSGGLLTNLPAGGSPQYFSDRFTTLPTGGFGTSQPFSALATDRLGVALNPVSGSTTLTLLSWGGGQVHIPSVQCANGVMYGFSVDGDGNNINSLETFGFSEVYYAPIK
jgi:hypothetical protein